MFNSSGVLIYDPPARIKAEPWWCILKTDEEIIRYYKAWIQKQYDLQFDKTVWGSHISIVRGTKPKNRIVWKKYKNEEIAFTYTNNIYRKHWFFCVDVQSERLETIREEMGLTRLPTAGFHLTIGRINKVYLQRKRELLKEFFSTTNATSINYNLTPLINI